MTRMSGRGDGRGRGSTAGVDPLDALRAETARHGYGVRIGRGRDGISCFAPPEHGLLVLGPPRSGKTTAVVIPNVVSACGAVVTTSTKNDVLTATSAARGRVGECLLFDPGGSTVAPPGVRPIGWSPLVSARSWEQASLTAQAMVLTARPGSERGESRHWTERAEALLAPCIHAAALDAMPMADVLSAVDRRQGTEFRSILAREDREIPLATLEGVLASDEREQSGIWSTASSILSAYRSEGALASAGRDALEPTAFVRGGDTLYVCSGTDEQRRAAPLVAGLLRDVRVAAYRAASEKLIGRGASRPPVLFVLDEVANIAPIHDLPTLAAEGASQGVLTIACLQDLSQAIARWGRLGEGFLGLFNSKLVFPGVGDTRTLEALSLLAGERETEAVSLSEGPRRPGLRGLVGRRSPGTRTLSTRKERVLPVETLAQGIAGHIVCLDGAVPSLVSNRPWFLDDLLRPAIERETGRQPPRPRLGLSR